MSYLVVWEPKARWRLGKVSEPLASEIEAAAAALSANPRPSGCKKLVNRDEWRIKVSFYRVIYRIDDDCKAVQILEVEKREKAYR